MTDNEVGLVVFLLYSRISEKNIGGSLGLPEYSYYFLLKEFRPVFEKLGDVTVIESPETEADAIFERCQANDEDCLLIAFTAPHNLPLGIRCPTVVVLAWEFPDIPDESWGGNPQNDWRVGLGRTLGAITLSRFARDAVRAAMGADYPLLAAPVPVWNRFGTEAAERPADRHWSDNELCIDGSILDTNACEFGPDRLRPMKPLESFEFGIWSGQEFTLDLRYGSIDTGYLGGFYLPEHWGTWSRNAEVFIALPHLLHGSIRISVVAQAHGSNIGRPMTFRIGRAAACIELGGELAERSIELELEEPANLLVINGLDATPRSTGSDERTLGIGIRSLTIRANDDTRTACAPVLELDLRAGSPHNRLLHGFYAPEEWGSWSMAATPWIRLPQPVAGDVTVRLQSMGYWHNVGASINVSLGPQSQSLTLASDLSEATCRFRIDEPAQILGFHGLRNAPVKESPDPRSLGIGVQSIEIHSTGAPDESAIPKTSPAGARNSIRVEEVLYCAVLNPADDRKNWLLILKAFIAAFSDEPDAALLLKMTHKSQASYLFELHYLLQRMPRFRCRVLILHGYMTDADFEGLARRTDWYVNLSKAEGLCIPLMEFMAAGVPAIVPRHTAMLDYVDDGNSLAPNCSTEPAIWPHDERELLRTLQYRIDWDSAVEAFRRSYGLVRDEPEAYSGMSRAAGETMRSYCGIDVVEDDVRRFLAGLTASHAEANSQLSTTGGLAS